VTIQKSTDAINWEPVGNFYDSAWGFSWDGNQAWVAVGSTDYEGTPNPQETITLGGFTGASGWFNINSGGFQISGYDVAYNGSYWVAVGTTSTTPDASIQISMDNQDWQNATSGGFSIAGRSVAWNGSYWIAGGFDSTKLNRIQKSVDGLNWTPSVAHNFDGFVSKVAWNGSYWLAAGADSSAVNQIEKSTDGLNWTSSANANFGTGVGKAARNLAWNGSQWVAVGNSVSGSNGSIATSTDGLNWTASLNGGFTTYGYAIVAASSITTSNTLVPITSALTPTSLSTQALFISSINGSAYTPGGGGTLSSNLAVSNITTSSINNFKLPKIQFGTDISLTATNAGSYTTITFLTPFSTPPVVTATNLLDSTYIVWTIMFSISNVTTTTFDVYSRDQYGTDMNARFSWIAMAYS
jgi:hypothetical protein